ncbi:TonB-dependent receptor [Rhizosphaericola mali]|uniref:TonB-dependent receptor n=1 Tax=Rhizosphaericola mali TaxID=2545455 RepID=A0A5P2G5B0_9BACT|nr:TonB-dependent receptor [Rhizosphaericola mali]QES89868.1 TonB-dependent receptor [Rhizosphaericola mali]
MSYKKAFWVVLPSLLLCMSQADAQRKGKTKAKPKTEKKASTSKKATTKPKEDLLPDNSQDRTVNITSAFTPTLRESSKINLNGTPTLPSQATPGLNYNVPAQNLFFPYAPGALRPLSLNEKYENPWKKDGFIKLGYGNYNTPYGEAGLSFGDGINSSFAIHAKHVSSKGPIIDQKYAQTNVDLNGVLNVGSNNELSGKLYYDNNRNRAYGIREDDRALYNSDSSKLFYNNYGIKLKLRNKAENDAGIDYSPSLAINHFSNNWNSNESSLYVDAPISKQIGDNFAINLGFTADITQFNRKDSAKINNNIYYVRPALSYKTDNVYIKAGFTPSWNNGNYKFLPDIQAEAKIKDERFVVQAGFTGYYEKNTYQSLVAFNPWINTPNELQNNRAREFYGGLKGSIGSHLTYNAKLSYITYYNHALFANDSLLGNRFNVMYEPKMNDLRIHAELGYKVAETFSVLAGMSINQYSNLDSSAKAFGLLPLELNGSMRWKVYKNIWVKSDVNFWNGTWGLDANQEPIKMKAVADWDAGLEMGLTNHWSVWLQVNNILNNKYQRWNQYQSLGTNVMGGIIYNFDLSKK